MKKIVLILSLFVLIFSIVKAQDPAKNKTTTVESKAGTEKIPVTVSSPEPLMRTEIITKTATTESKKKVDQKNNSKKNADEK